LREVNLINIGKIVGTYGYQGMVRIIPWTDFRERFKSNGGNCPSSSRRLPAKTARN